MRACGKQWRIACASRKRRVLAQFVVIIEILVAQHQAKDPLPNQRLDPVLDVTRIATTGEATREPADQSKAAINLSQQQRPRVRGNVAAIETGYHSPPLNRFKFEQRHATLSLHRGDPWITEKTLLHSDALRFRPRCTSLV